MDDSPLVLTFFGDRLRGMGYEVATADLGPEALELAMRSELSFDLFLVDVLMPGMDGYEVARRLRAEARTKDTPILFLTSLGDASMRAEDPELEEEVAEALEAGADDFLGKGATDEELAFRVEALLDLGRRRKLLSQLAPA